MTTPTQYFIFRDTPKERLEHHMPKIKTRKAAAKRFRIKPSGQIKRDHANHEHIATKKSKDRKNRLKKSTVVSQPDKQLVLRCLPNR